MDEKSTDTTSENIENKIDIPEISPEIIDDITTDVKTNLSTKLKIRRILSCVGSAIGLGIAAYTLNAYAECPGGECSVSWFGEIWYAVSIYILLFSVAGYISTLKSYQDTERRSIIGIVSGGVVSICLIIFLIFIFNRSAHLLSSGESFSFMISATVPIIAFVFPVLSIWLFILLKSFLIKKRLRCIFIFLFVSTIALTIYGSIAYFTSPAYITDSKNNKLFSNINRNTSYTSKYEMVVKFIKSLGKSDLEATYSFYYPSQKGSDVVRDVKGYTNYTEKYLSNGYKYTGADYSKQQCRVDSAGNHYYLNVIIRTSEPDSPFVIDVKLINEAKTDLWYVMAKTYDIETTEC